MVTVVIPTVVLMSTGGTLAKAFAGPRIVTTAVGTILIAIGLFLLVKTVVLFARIGQGTLAPWNPTQRLVVQGVYRYVRNPMISGVCFILLGEAIAFWSLPLLVWFGIFFTANSIYMPLSEEPGLAERFGDEYREYRRNVPRWIPRLEPWNPPQQ